MDYNILKILAGDFNDIVARATAALAEMAGEVQAELRRVIAAI